MNKKKGLIIFIVLIGIISISMWLINKDTSSEKTTESTQKTNSQVFDAKGNLIKVIGE